MKLHFALRPVCEMDFNMLPRILIQLILNILTGLIGHVIFYPIIEAWGNNRARKLARPAIGVALTTFPYLMWLHELERDDRCTPGWAFAAYCISFLWSAVGVVAGYMLDDWRKNGH